MSFFLSKDSPALDKREFNETILKLKGKIRLTRVSTIHKLARQAKVLKEKKYAKDEKVKLKNEAKADRFIEQVMFLKGLHINDLTMLIAVYSKTAKDIGKDANASIEDRAFCTVSNHQKVVEVVSNFRRKFPNWKKEAPDVIKGLGILYRKKRLSRYQKSGKLDEFLEREKKLFRLLQDVVGLDIDAKLLQNSGPLKVKSKTKNVNKLKSKENIATLESESEDDDAIKSESDNEVGSEKASSSENESEDDDAVTAYLKAGSDEDAKSESDYEVGSDDQGSEMASLSGNESEGEISGPVRYLQSSTDEDEEILDGDASITLENGCNNDNRLGNSSDIENDPANKVRKGFKTKLPKKIKNVKKKLKSKPDFSSRNKGTTSVKRVNLLNLLKTGETINFGERQNIDGDSEEDETILRSLNAPIIKTVSLRKEKGNKRKLPERETNNDKDDLEDYDYSSKYFRSSKRADGERGTRRGMGGRGGGRSGREGEREKISEPKEDRRHSNSDGSSRGRFRGRGRGGGRSRGGFDGKRRGGFDGERRGGHGDRGRSRGGFGGERRGGSRGGFDGERRGGFDGERRGGSGDRGRRGGGFDGERRGDFGDRGSSRGGRGDFNKFDKFSAQNDSKDSKGGQVRLGRMGKDDNPNFTPIVQRQNRTSNTSTNIHPSWAAKKAVDIAIGTYQGKKTTFD